ncbi:hypothetical protein G3580_18165 [Nitrogeniibacter mangrovi]|uniref:TnsE C-terminal domain-containing protein n=1 Tax=Nitrogeniibacter mangrovi TaxID=2016596 RepID=A0A6C1BAF8_9RHOO|nr:hypothetical protein [Nitrogeniibacter mangrovi]QID19370.1 hypothetical protein G3580_18165 [Nitrogeniibacter mangrovi]
MPEPVDRIEEFPKDGRLWWITWVDGYSVPHGGTATPSVEVELTRLEANLEDLFRLDSRRTVKVELGATPPEHLIVRVLSGYVPRLVLGMVFKDGVEVGSLPMEEFEFSTAYGEVDLRQIRERMEDPPRWWNSAHTYKVMNPTSYRLERRFDQSRAVIITDGSGIAVVPCHEIFRSMYATHTDIALALTSGPWRDTMDFVVSSQRTGVRTDGLWQVCLRRRIADLHAPLLANLVLGEDGRKAANGIYASLLASRNGAGSIAARIPFDTSEVRLKVKGVLLHDNPVKLLVFQVSEIDWVGPCDIVVMRDNDASKGKSLTETDRQKPYSSRDRHVAERLDGTMAAASNEDPSAHAAVTNISVPLPVWRIPPQLKKEEKEESFLYASGRPGGDDELLEQLSAGNEWYGESRSGRVDYSFRRRDHTTRFTEIAQMLDRLATAGRIDRWEVVQEESERFFFGSLPVWPFPTRINGSKLGLRYSYIEKATRQVRTALVCRVAIGGRIVYWMEIEIERRSNGKPSWVFALGEYPESSTIRSVLQLAAKTGGSWPSEDMLIQTVGVTAAEPWKHTHINKRRKGEGGRFNEDRALETMMTVLAKAEPLPTMLANSQIGL